MESQAAQTYYVWIRAFRGQGQIVGARERLNGRKKLLFFAPFFSARLAFPLPPLAICPWVSEDASDAK